MIYAAIHTCNLRKLSGTTIEGLAYPRSGPHCCAIKLVSDGRTVGAVRADRFSKAAADLRLRDGWCAFHIELTRNHFIFSDRLALQCMVSGTVVHAVGFDTVGWDDHGNGSPRPRPVPLDELIFPRSDSAQSDIRTYQPLIDRLANTLNDHQYVDFAFRFVLGRDPDGSGKETYLSMIRGGGDRNALLLTLLNSEEFARNRRGQLPSPFDERFPAVPVFLPSG